MQGDEGTTPQLNVNDLYSRRQTRDSARLQTYNKILQIIYHKIRVTSQMANSPCSVLYTIPPFILGLPRIDLEDCVVYIVYQLRMNGFEVRFTYPNLLNINWSLHEKSYLLEQSPIMQAMLESDRKRREEEERKAIFSRRLVGKQKTGGGGGGPPKAKSGGVAAGKKRVDFRNEVVIGGAGGGMMRDHDAPSVGQIPSASEYIPPVTFLKQMTEPPPRPSVSFAQDGGGGGGSSGSTSRGGNPLADLWT
jgi:hypothetical protein